MGEQSGESVAQKTVGESTGKLRKSQQGLAQGLDLGIGEAQGRSSLVVYWAGAMHLLEGVFGEHAIMADFLHFQQSPVGLEADLSQRR